MHIQIDFDKDSTIILSPFNFSWKESFDSFVLVAAAGP